MIEAFLFIRMTREIKFRGLNSNKELVYGSLIKSRIGLMIIEDGETFNHSHELPNSRYGFMATGHLINDNSLGQFTGLLDKNGTEIYEGDILQLEKRFYWNDELDISERHKDIVYVKAENMLDVKCFYCDGGRKWDNGFDYSDYSDDWHDDLSEVTVIGNIYQNPELINNKTN